MRTVLIVAMTESRLIGKAGGLPWRVSADLKHFKRTTMGHAVIMGRKTFDSCGKPLPGRRNIVITRHSGFSAEGVDVAASLEDALALCRRRGEQIAFIAGGAQIYRAALPVVEEMIVTYIEAPGAEGDTWFPEWNPDEWVSSPYAADAALRVVHYRRR